MPGWYGRLAGANDPEREALLARARAGGVARHHAGAVAARLQGAVLEATAELQALQAGRIERLQLAGAQPAGTGLHLGVGSVTGCEAASGAAAGGRPGASAGAPLDGDRDL